MVERERVGQVGGVCWEWLWWSVRGWPVGGGCGGV